jgi:hypothetical protein
MSGQHAMDLPVTLDAALSTRLRELLCADARPGGGDGAGALQAALDDPAVHAVVIALALRGEPAASLVQVLRGSDPLAVWIGLGCI